MLTKREFSYCPWPDHKGEPENCFYTFLKSLKRVYFDQKKRWQGKFKDLRYHTAMKPLYSSARWADQPSMFVEENLPL
jgi:hypothetical protein